MTELREKGDRGVKPPDNSPNRFERQISLERLHDILEDTLGMVLICGFWGGMGAMGVGAMIDNPEIIRYGAKAAVSTTTVGAATFALAWAGIIE